MKKILYIITKGEVGGAQMSVLNLAKGMKQNDIEAGIVFGEGDFLKKELKKNGIKHWQFKHLKRTHNPLKSFLFAFDLYKFIKTNHFDVVHFNSSNTLPGALAIKKANKQIKTIFTFRGLSLLDQNYQTNWLLKTAYSLYFKIFCHYIDENVFVSRANYNYATKNKLANNASFIYNGLNSDNVVLQDQAEAKKNLSKLAERDLNQKFVIGSIGRLTYAKNYEFLISVFPKILKIKPEAIAIIIGDGDEYDNYQKLIKEAGLDNNIILTGSIDHASKFIKGFDLFVLPSRYEGLSITLIEALIAGSPILGSDVGGNHEMTNDDRQIFELNNQADFINKFKNLSNKSKLHECSKNNLEASSNFHIKNTINNYYKLYNK